MLGGGKMATVQAPFSNTRYFLFCHQIQCTLCRPSRWITFFFHWIQWHFWPWFFCSYNFALNSVNFLAPTWSLKKTFCSSPLYSKFPPTDFGEMNNSSLILVKKKRPMLSPKLKNTSSYSAKNLLVLQCNGFENERHQQCMFKCGPSCPSSG